MLAVGAVWPAAIIRFTLHDVRDAHRISEARRPQGKLVLELR